MKKLISVCLAVVLSATMVFAQQNRGHKKQENKEAWRDKVRAEQVAYITSELDLSEAEAQAFWPVYNDVQAQRREAFGNVFQAFVALKDHADEGQADALLEQYLAAKKVSDQLETDRVARYQAVLPANKVAKLIVAEEMFRREQIGRLGGNRGPGGHPGGRPQGASDDNISAPRTHRPNR